MKDPKIKLKKLMTSHAFIIYDQAAGQAINKFRSGELNPYKIIKEYENRSWFSKWFSWGCWSDAILYDSARVYNIMRSSLLSKLLKKEN